MQSNGPASVIIWIYNICNTNTYKKGIAELNIFVSVGFPPEKHEWIRCVRWFTIYVCM